MATVTLAHGQLAFKATEDWPKGFALVEGWLDFETADCRRMSLPAYGGSDPLHPGYDEMCVATLSASQTPTYSVPADGRRVDAVPSLVSPAPSILSVPASVHGVFLVHYNPLCSLSNPTDCEDWQVIGRVDPLDLSRTLTP
jgi:hypothetical protein